MEILLSSLYGATILLYLILLGILFPKMLHSPIYRAFFIFLTGTALWVATLFLYFLAPLDTSLLFVGRLNFASGIVIVVALLIFFHIFPKPIFSISTTLQRILFGGTTALFLGTLVTPFVDKNEIITEYGPIFTPGVGYPLFVGFVVIVILTTLLLGIQKIRTLTGLDAIRFRYAFWVSMISCCVGVMSNAILPMFQIFLFQEYSFLLTVPMAGALLFIIQKYRFFHPHFLLLSALRTITLLLFGFLSFTLSLHLFSVWQNRETTAAMLASLTITLLLFHSVSKRFPEFLPSHFRDFRRYLSMLPLQMESCTTIDELQKKLEKTFLLQCHIENARIFVMPKEEKSTEKSLFFPVFTELQKQKDGVLVAAERKTRPDVRKKNIFALQILDAELYFLLFAESKPIGFWTLGTKADKTPYSQEEIEECIRFSKRMEVIFFNILIQTDFQQEQNILKEIVQEKTKQLRKQNQQMKELSQQQADFIAIAAHEFRTPLTIALFQIEEIEKNEEIQRVYDSLQHLKELTHRLFEVQQYDLNKVEIHQEEVHIKEFLAEIEADFLPLFDEKKLVMQVENRIPPYTTHLMDKAQMRQVFQNLLGNAIKFTPPKGVIRIGAEKKKKSIRLFVSNTGKHLDAETKKRLFDKFFTNQNMGIGLGLHIVKSIISLHKGKITVTNEGTDQVTFSITLFKNL